jgi:hypothetical protein
LPAFHHRLLPTMSRNALVLACILAMGAGTAVAAPPRLDLTVEPARDGNVTRGEQREDVLTDSYVNTALAVNWDAALADFGTVTAGLGLRGARYLRYSRLSNVGIDAALALERKLGLGLTAPWVVAAVTLSHEDYREAVRDSDRLTLRVEAGRRFDPRIDASAGFVFERRYGRHDDPAVPGISGDVWSLTGQSGFVRAGYALTEHWLLDVGYALRRGDVVATTHRNLDIFLASDAITESHAFGPGFFDYRLRGTTQTGNGTLSYALGDDASLNLTLAWSSTRAARGLDYRGTLVAASWIGRF